MLLLYPGELYRLLGASSLGLPCHSLNILIFVVLFIIGLKGSLDRLQLDYVDIVFANRPDSHTPMEGKMSKKSLKVQ